jgi:TP901 family phage tail tape measure protein
LANERFNISLGLDTSPALIDLKRFGKQAQLEQEKIQKRLSGMSVSVDLADTAIGVDRVIRNIDRVRDRYKTLEKERKALGKLMKEEWDTMSPEVKSQRGAKMKSLKADIAKNESEQKQLLGEFRKIIEGPINLITGLRTELKSSRAKLAAMKPSEAQLDISSELKTITDSVTSAHKQLANARGMIKKIKSDSMAEWKASDSPKTSETRKKHVVAMREKQAPFIEEEKRLEAEIAAMTSRATKLKRNFSGAASLEYKKLAEHVKDIEEWLKETIKFQSYLEVTLSSNNLPTNLVTTAFKPSQRGTKKKNQDKPLVNYDPLAGLNIDAVTSSVARSVAEEFLKRIKKSNVPGSGALNDLIIQALVQRDVITAEQAASVIASREASVLKLASEALGTGRGDKTKAALKALTAEAAPGLSGPISQDFTSKSGQESSEFTAGFAGALKGQIEAALASGGVTFTGIGVRKEDIGDIISQTMKTLNIEESDDEDTDSEIAQAQTLGDILTVLEQNQDNDESEAITRSQYSADDKENADRLSNQRQDVGLGSDIITEAEALRKQAKEKNDLVMTILEMISLGNEVGGLRGSKIGSSYDPETGMNSRGIAPLDYIGGLFPIEKLGEEDDPNFGGLTIAADDFIRAFTDATAALKIINKGNTRGSVPTAGIVQQNPKPFYSSEDEYSSELTKVDIATEIARRNAAQAAWDARALKDGKKKGSTQLGFSDSQEDVYGGVPKIGQSYDITQKIWEMIKKITMGARNPELVYGTGIPRFTAPVEGDFPVQSKGSINVRGTDADGVGRLVNSQWNSFMEDLKNLPAGAQDLIAIAEQFGIFTGMLTDNLQTSGAQLSKLGMGNMNIPDQNTLEKLFDQNNYSPSSTVKFIDPTTGQETSSSTTGSTPGSYMGGTDIGVRMFAPIVKILMSLEQDFTAIYKGSFADLIGQIGKFDPETFKPASPIGPYQEGREPVEMGYGEAFVKNRDAFFTYISHAAQRTLNSDITSALPQVDAMFEKATATSANGGPYSRGEMQSYRNRYQASQDPSQLGFSERDRDAFMRERSVQQDAVDKFGGYSPDIFEQGKADAAKVFKEYFKEEYERVEALLVEQLESGEFAGDEENPVDMIDQVKAVRQKFNKWISEILGSYVDGLDLTEKTPSLKDLGGFMGPIDSWALGQAEKQIGERPTGRQFNAQGQKPPVSSSLDQEFYQGELEDMMRPVELIPGINPDQLIEIKPAVDDIVAGLTQGLSAKENEIYEAGGDMGQALGDGFDDKTGRNSPAQYFIDAASDSAEGVIVGARKRLKDLNEAGRAMAESFNSGYSDQAKVNAIAKIQELENAGLTKQAEALKAQMRQAPAEDRKPGKPGKPGQGETGFVLRGEKEVAERNKKLAERLKELAKSQDDLLVALDIESTGGRPGKRNMAYAVGASAGYGVESEGRAAGNPNVPFVVPQSEGLMFNMVVPPKDPRDETLFTRDAATSVGLADKDNFDGREILPNLIERIKSLGLGEENTKGNEQAYVDQLQDIAFLLNQLYEKQIPLSIHSKSLTDLTTLGKEFANYGIAAPTGKQFEDAGLLVETNNMAEMLKQLFGKTIPKSISGIYEFFAGKLPGPELIPKTGVKPTYTDATAQAHDPEIDSQASLVIGFSMRKMAEEVGAKQITITKAVTDFVKASWTTVSDAIGGFRRFGPGKGNPKKKFSDPADLPSYNQQTATHGGAIQPAVPTVPRRAPSAQPAPAQPTLFEDETVDVDSAMNDAERMRILEEELAKLEEQREVEKEKLKLERQRLKELYEIEKVIEAMSENRGIGFDNLTNSPINNRVIQDKDKARLAKNNEIVNKAKEDPAMFAEVERQIASRWGKVPERFVATLGTASRELADAIQKAIDRVNRKINAIQVENGSRTPTPRGPRPPGGGGKKPPGPRPPDDIPGGPDSPTPEYQDLMDGKITGNQHQAWIDQEIERAELESKARNKSLEAQSKAVQAHEKVVADANRKMVDSWISTRYSLYDVASTYEDMGKKLRVLTSYIQQAVMVNSSYETSFTAVERVMQPLPDEIDGMRQRLVLMTQELPVAFDHLAKIATLGGQMGIEADGINNFTEQVVKYSAITGMSADTVAEKFGRISQLAKIPAEDFNKLASAVSYAGINAVATDQEIITLTESIAAAANLAGFGADETIGLATAISSLGIAPEQARGVIVRLFGDIERGMQNGGKELTAYSKHLGLSAKETKNLWETDPQAFFKRMLENLAGAESMTTALDKLNIVETREVNTLQRLANNMDTYNQSMSDAQESYENGTFLGEAYAKTQDNVAAKLEILNNQMKILQDNIGDAFAEGPIGLKAILDGLSAFMEFVNKVTSSPIGKVITGIVAGVTAMVAVFVAYQVASYKATAATLAMKTAMVQLGKMGGENTGIKGLLDVLTGQERMIIDSNGRLRSITKDRLEEMKELGKIVPDGSPIDRALKAGLDVRKAANPGLMDDEIAYKAGMTLGPLSENPEGLLPNVAEELQGPSIAQLQEQIAVNRQLIEIRAQIAQSSLEASEKLRIYALAQGDAAAAEKAAAASAASSREIGQLESLDKGLEENLNALENASIDPEAVVPKEVATNVEKSTEALNDMGAGLDSVASEADKGSVATTRFGKAMGVALKAAGWLSLILTVVGAATQIYKDMQINLEEAGGGLDSFREAIYKDTAAWKENGEAINTVQSKVTTSKTELTTWAQSMEATTGSSAKMTTAITETTDSITEQTLALGENSMEWLAQAAMADDRIQGMFKGYFEAGKDLDQLSKKANINIQDMVGMALSDPGKGAANYLREWFTASADLRAEAPNLYTDLLQIADALDGTTKSGIENSKIMKALGGAFGQADDGAGDLNNELDNTIARVYTLTDYVGDLSSILSAAFTIRYGKEEATDALAASWENVKNRIDDAREAIEKIKDEIKSMTADRNILEYQLNIALKYGDSMRADKLRAELEAKDKELADKSKELGTAQDGASTSLVGNTKAAADNRAVMRGLIQDYNKYLESLANTNLSQKELKKRSDQAKADMLAQGQALGFSAEEMAPYTKSFKDFRTIVDKLPKELTLRVDADPGTRAFMEWWVKQKSGSGSGSNNKNDSSSTGGTSNRQPGEKPKKPWTGPSTDKWNPEEDGKPIKNEAGAWENIKGATFNFAEIAYGLLGGITGGLLSGLASVKLLNPFEDWDTKWESYTEQVSGWMPDQLEADKADLHYQRRVEFQGWDQRKEDAEYEKRLAAWEAAAPKRAALQAGASKADLEAMAKKHAESSPGAWNPFSGTFNPAIPWSGDESTPYPSRVDKKVSEKDGQNNANDIVTGFKLETGLKRGDAWKKYNQDVANDAQSSRIEAQYSRAGLGSSALKESAAIHAKRYPGEYNPFNRTQNPWPKSNKIVSDKGLVVRKTQAQIHAATHPGEYNPYSGQVNPMDPVDKKLADALKDKKTRKALGEEHARLYPGEFNPYTETVNPMFTKDSKKGTKEIVDNKVKNPMGDLLAGTIKYQENLAKQKLIGKKKSEPLYAYIVGTDVKTNYSGGLVGYASGGLIPGKSPQNPSVDNLLASGPGGVIGIRSGEFIQSQPAVQYYGLDFMNAINNLQIPRYASGGMIGTVSGGGSSVVELSSSAVMQIMALANRPVNLYSDDRQIASSANRGNMLLAMRGSN